MGRGYPLSGTERDFYQRDANVWPPGEGKFAERIISGGVSIDDDHFVTTSAIKPMVCFLLLCPLGIIIILK
jgi:hypothetical protein